MLTGEGVTPGDESDHPPQDYMEGMRLSLLIIGAVEREGIRRSPLFNTEEAQLTSANNHYGEGVKTLTKSLLLAGLYF